MNWYRNPSAIEQLAAAYVAGTLRGPARRRFEMAMQTRPALVVAVNEWTRRLGPLHQALPEQAPSAALWTRIAQQTVHRTAPAATPSWWRRLLAPAPAGALVVGLLVGTLLPLAWQAQESARRDMQLPDSYVGVLATREGQPGLIVSSLRRGTRVDIKQVTPVAVPAGHTLFLWRIDKAGAVAPVGPLPEGKFVHVALDAPAEKVFFPAVELAVSIEPAGARPEAPSSPFVYRGLCGKVWR